MIELDGSLGEGGGQILRTSLALSMITGIPFHVQNIRANRPKSGLMRQHLVAVQAAAQVCGAQLSHAEIGSQSLEFHPGPIQPGAYQFAIGTAGSSTLVLQTVLPALLFASKPSTVHVSGGTHNSMAPPVQFLQRAYARVLASMGASIDIQLLRSGFYPAGGGEVLTKIQPCAKLQEIDLTDRGELLDAYAEAFIAGIPPSIAQRELDSVGASLNWQDSQLYIQELPREQGPGNALLITLEHEHVTEVFTGFGEKRKRAEDVAEGVLAEVKNYINSGAAAGEHLADQIMLPMALAGGGRFTTSHVSQHAITNAEVIGKFLPIEISFTTGAIGSECVLRPIG
jgi:RNA 3'-terminal phosphate cyclase (ATP)